jgi:hypothetical protein
MKYQIMIHILDDSLIELDKTNHKRSYLILFKMIGNSINEIMKQFYKLYSNIVKDYNIKIDEIERCMHINRIDTEKLTKWETLFTSSAFYKGNSLL